MNLIPGWKIEHLIHFLVALLNLFQYFFLKPLSFISDHLGIFYVLLFSTITERGVFLFCFPRTYYGSIKHAFTLNKTEGYDAWRCEGFVFAA